jgi:hypothetical protein
MAKSISLGYTSTSGYTSTTGNTSINTIQPQAFQPTKHTYHLLGEDIIVESAHDTFSAAQTIALINCIGWSYYEEIKKQGVNFDDQLKKILEPRYKSYLRNKSITNILD